MSAQVSVPDSTDPHRPTPHGQPSKGPSTTFGTYSRAGVAPSRRRPSVELAASRAYASNDNHHLWKNGRLWWIAFTLIHDGWRQERVRQSLGTDNLLEARRRRDAILSLFAPGACNSCIDPEPEAVTN